jgi:hypothetical protein
LPDRKAELARLRLALPPSVEMSKTTAFNFAWLSFGSVMNGIVGCGIVAGTLLQVRELPCITERSDTNVTTAHCVPLNTVTDAMLSPAAGEISRASAEADNVSDKAARTSLVVESCIVVSSFLEEKLFFEVVRQHRRVADILSR